MYRAEKKRSTRAESSWMERPTKRARERERGEGGRERGERERQIRKVITVTVRAALIPSFIDCIVRGERCTLYAVNVRRI